MHQSYATGASRHDHVCWIQLWRHATEIHCIAEVILGGVATVKSSCSTIGRNAMSAGSRLLMCMHVAAACQLIAQLHIFAACQSLVLHVSQRLLVSADDSG